MTMLETMKRMLGRIPGGVEAALYLRDIIVPPSSGRLSWKALPGWLNELDKAHRGRPGAPKKVLIFAVYSGWVRFNLAVSVVLFGRGYEVDFAFLPYVAFAQDEIPHVARSRHFYYRKFIGVPPRPGLRMIDVSRLPLTALDDEMRQAARAQSRVDIQWILTRELVDMSEGGQDQKLFEFRALRNLDCMSRLASLLKANAYDAILTPNGNLVEFGALFRLAQIMGRPVTTFEFPERLKAIVFSRHAPVVHCPTSPDWMKLAPHTLSVAARARVQELIFTRQGTRWHGFVESYQRAPYQGRAEAVLEKLEIPNDGRPLALLCPNIPWDSAWLGLDRIFPTHMEWLRQTIAYFARRPDSRLVVRIHPAETSAGTGEPLQPRIRQWFPTLPPHIRCIGPDDPVNTYDLMDVCDLGLVYQSTTGLEMAMRGIPVVVAGSPHYAGKGFTRDPGTAEEYFARIGRILEDPRAFRLSAEERDLAWCYADFYFFHWGKPFPWGLLTFWKDLEEWPIGRVLSEEGAAAFGPSFDALIDDGG